MYALLKMYDGIKRKIVIIVYSQQSHLFTFAILMWFSALCILFNLIA